MAALANISTSTISKFHFVKKLFSTRKLYYYPLSRFTKLGEHLFTIFHFTNYTVYIFNQTEILFFVTAYS